MNEKFARWDLLLGQYFKRDWKKIIFWVLGIGLFSGGFVPAFEEIAKGQGLVGMFETLKNPAMISMVGPTPIQSAFDYTLGAMYAHEMLLFCGLFSMIVSGLHVISHTRKEEELGLTELVRSFQVGRQANSLAVIKETITINLLLVAVIAGLMLFFSGESMDTESIFLFALSIGSAGMIGAVIALLFAQILPTSSGATSGTLSLIGLLYILRAGTDVSHPDFSLFNPMGWTYLTYPFTENRWEILLLVGGFLVGIFCLAIVLENYRDMGAGYLPEWAGRAEAKKSMLSVPGLLLRINRGTIISWLIGYLILGAAYGSIYGDIGTFLSSNELMEQMFTQAGVSMEESFTTTIMAIMMLLALILPIVLINRLFSEETRLHFSQLYATKMTRAQLYWSTIFLALLFGSVSILFSAGGLGSAASLSINGDSDIAVSDFLGAGFNYFPGMLFFVGLAALFLGWLPKMNKLVYGYLGYTFVLSYFGGILDLPDGFSKTAIFNWIPAMPTDDFSVSIFLILSLIGLGMILVGYLGYKKRDFIEGI